MTRSRRILFTLSGVLVALALIVPPASAGGGAAVSVADRKGDGTGPGDVRALRIAQNGSSFIARLRTEKPLNLDTAPAWQTQGTRSIVRVYLDNRTDTTGPDDVLVIDNDENGFLRVRLLGLTVWRPEGGCVPVLQQPQLTQIQITLDIGCVSGDDTGIRAYASYRLDRGGNGTIDSVDKAPNAGYTPLLNLVA